VLIEMILQLKEYLNFLKDNFSGGSNIGRLEYLIHIK